MTTGLLRCVAVRFVFCGLLMTGCQEKRTFTLNPDGSGKVVFECQRQQDVTTAYGRSCWPHSILLKNGKGVESWADASIRQRDGKTFFRGTALFPDINKVDVWSSASSPVLPMWKVQDDDLAVLELARPSWPGPAGKPAPLSEAKIAEQVKALRDKPVAPEFIGEDALRMLRLEYVFDVPGRVVEQSNFILGKDGTLSLTLTGEGIIEAAAAIKANDGELRELVLAGEGASSGGKLMEAKMCREMFGKEAGVSAKVKVDGKPKFDYVAEVAAAKKNYLAMMTKLGLYWEDIPKDMTLRFKRLKLRYRTNVGIELEAEPPRAAVEYRGGFVFRMVGEDGALLLPRPGKSQELGRYSGTSTGPIIRVPDDLPAGAKTLKEVLGAAFYVAADEEHVDLGFERIAEGARGKALDARIISMTTTNASDKEQVRIDVEIRVPKGAKLQEIAYSLPAGRPAPRLIQSSPFAAHEGLTARMFIFEGPLAEKPSFNAKLWKNVEEFAVPFRLTDIPLTVGGR